ncbi:MAG: cysteine-rich CWC family protein [Ramlibacter sp.]
MPAAPLPAVDPGQCPLCGQPNGCAMERERATGVPQPPCWCTAATFGRELLEQLPDDRRGQACICASCAGAAAR